MSSDSEIHINAEKCNGCGRCVDACPFAAIALEEGIAVIDKTVCTLCGACAAVCPIEGAIAWTDTTAARRHHSEKGDVWVYCERTGRDANSLMPVSLELIGRARELADSMAVNVHAIILSPDADFVPEYLFAYGVDVLHVVPHSTFHFFHDETFAHVLARIVKRESAGILIAGATAVGRALMPRLAVLLDTGLTADCTELEIDPESGVLLQKRPAFGGNILATIVCEQNRPQMATVRPGVFSCPEPDTQRQGDIVDEEIGDEELACQTDVLAVVSTAEASENSLQESEVVVAAGYGVGGVEGVALIRELSRALGGALAASRAVVDAGWLPYEHQVGQTGVTVQPRVYIACGVSGAIQHQVGMQKAEKIVAINRDPEARIFDIADYCLVGDVHDITRSLIEAVSVKGSI